jgi:hypothetical protein
MAMKNITRIKLELAACSAIGVAGLLTGVSIVNPSGLPKYLYTALGSSLIASIAVTGYHALKDKTGVLEREITRLGLHSASLQKKIDTESEQSAEILKIIENLESEKVALQSELLALQSQAQEVVKAGNTWKQSAVDRNTEIKRLKSELGTIEKQLAEALEENETEFNKAITEATKERNTQLHTKAVNKFKKIKADFEASLRADFEQELVKYQGRIAELNTELEALQTELDEVAADRDRLTQALTSLHKEDLPDIQKTFEIEWEQNDQLMQAAIEQLQRKNAELQAPREFPGSTSIDITGNRIIHHFAAYGVLLDAVESISIPQGFRLRFKFDRTNEFTKLTEEEFDKHTKEPGLMGLSYAPLDFVFDARNFIVSVDIVTAPLVATAANGTTATIKPATVAEALEAVANGSTTSQNAFSASGCFPASEFENVIRDKFVPRVRVVAGSTGGKSPLMELIAVALAKINQAELWLLNPLPGSPKDWFSVPGLIAPGSDGIQSEIAWLGTAHKELGERRENLGVKQKFIMICADEINALARDYENLGTVLKDFYQLSDHAQMGIITAGQGGNVSGVSGGASKKATGNASKLMEEDFQNATQVFTSQAAKVWLTKNNKALLPNLAELEKLCSELNKAEGLSPRPKPGTKVVDRNAYRVALVVSPATDEPFFIQIPAYSFYAGKLDGVSFPSGATVTAPYENQVALGLAANHEECPQCQSRNTKVNKTLKASVKRVCSACGIYYNVPKSAAEVV